MMHRLIRRRTARWIHILAGGFNLAFIYTPLHGWSYGLLVVQWGTMPLLALTGYRLLAKRLHAAPPAPSTLGIFS